ncbi:MAG: MFS transporter [Geodermatophilaceae bacterium]|nr:MFS transporter [Geodermatophilaceae bacterium]
MTEESTNTEPARMAGRREWLGLTVLALPTLLLSLDMSVLYIALPNLSADLGAGGTEQLWIMDIYGFMIAGFLITMGTLGDRIGRRKLLMIGASAFGIASVLAAYSPNVEALIIARALLGIAGATLMPSTLALISNMFNDPHQRGVAISVWISCFMGGMTVGPLVGGALLENFWWGSAFLLGVPVMVLLLISAPILLPEYRDPDGGRLDLISVALSLGAILPIIYGLKELAKSGLDGRSGAAIVIGLVVGVVFVRRQKVLTSPLLDLRLFSNPLFTGAVGLSLFGCILWAGTFLLVTLYLQLVLGLSPLASGLWLVPMNLGLVIATMTAPFLAQRLRPGYVMAGGMAITTVGLLLLTQVDSVGGLPLVVTGLVLACTGVGPISSLGNGVILASAPPEKAGSASSISETAAELGFALGVAVLGTIGAAVYRSRLSDSLDGLPAEAVSATRESIAGADAAAAQLPDQLGADLLAAARDAFTDGLNVVAGISAALFLILAVITAVLFRHLPRVADPKAAGDHPDEVDAGTADAETAPDSALAADESPTAETPNRQETASESRVNSQDG